MNTAQYKKYSVEAAVGELLQQLECRWFDAQFQLATSLPDSDTTLSAAVQTKRSFYTSTI